MASPIAGLFAGLAQGGLESYVVKKEEERRAQLRAGKMILDLAMSTGDIGPLKLVDPKFMKSMGIDPTQIDAIGQMLEPIRQERQSKTRLAGAQAGQMEASAKKTGIEASEMEATSTMISGLSPEEQKVARVPELGKAAVAKQQADAATTSAQASVVRAEKDLSFEQRLQMQQNEINGQLKIANMRRASGASDVEGRMVRMEEMKGARGLLKEFSDEVATSDKTIMEKLATKTAKGQPLFDDEATARAAAELHNAKVRRFLQQAGTFKEKYGMDVPLYDEYDVVPITEKSMLAFLGKGPSTTGFTLTPRKGQVASEQAPQTSATSAGDFTLSSDEAAQMEKLKQRKKAIK